MFTPIHMHMLVRGRSTSVPIEEIAAKQFLRELVFEVGMKAATEPQAKYIRTPGNEGLTASINLYTSHAAFHVWDTTGLVMLDLYSCTCFNDDVVIDYIQKYFNFDVVEWTIINREDNSIYDNLKRFD